MEFKTRDEIRTAYEDEAVAETYWDRRFREPIGRLLHRRQFAGLEKVIRTTHPAQILELAPGPARLTLEVARLAGPGVFVDASAQMLNVATRRLRAENIDRWYPVRADAFALPMRGQFDLVYTFRFIRHFDVADRMRLYAEIFRVLKPGGWLVFDAVNREVSAPLREAHPEAYQHYDALFTRADIEREVLRAGFDDITLSGVQYHYGWLARLQLLLAPRAPELAFAVMRALETYPAGQPLEWIVTARKSS